MFVVEEAERRSTAGKLLSTTENGVDNGTIIGTEQWSRQFQKDGSSTPFGKPSFRSLLPATRQASNGSQTFLWLEVAVKVWP